MLEFVFIMFCYGMMIIAPMLVIMAIYEFLENIYDVFFDK